MSRPKLIAYYTVAIAWKHFLRVARATDWRWSRTALALTVVTTLASTVNAASPFQQYLSAGPVPIPGLGTFNTVSTFTDWDRDGRADLVQIKQQGTGTGSTEVHIYSGISGFRSALLHTGTALHHTDNSYFFKLLDWDRDGWPDLIIVKTMGTGTGSTEVHVLSGRSNFSEWLLHTGTTLHEGHGWFEFEFADWNLDGRIDMVAFKKTATESNRTEVHIFDGRNSFMRPLLQTSTPLEETGNDFAFAPADWNADRRPDLIAVKKYSTGTSSTEVHIFDGRRRFQSALVHTGTILPESDQKDQVSILDWNRDGAIDVAIVKDRGTARSPGLLSIDVVSGSSAPTPPQSGGTSFAVTNCNSVQARIVLRLNAAIEREWILLPNDLVGANFFLADGQIRDLDAYVWLAGSPGVWLGPQTSRIRGSAQQAQLRIPLGPCSR